MELELIIPVEAGTMREKGEEEINGRLWRVCSYTPEAIKSIRFHYVSYAWGSDVERPGRFFVCERSISDMTRPALEAAIKASEVLNRDKPAMEKVEAFWIDAICIPPFRGKARQATLESMGYIFSAASSVIVVLQGPIWRIIGPAVSGKSPSPSPFSASDLHILEEDPWVSRVWTYPELVNGAATYFTTTTPNASPPVVQVKRFLECVGASLSKWRRDHDECELEILVNLRRLRILEGLLGDILLKDHREKSALDVLSSIEFQDTDANFPQNRLLACLGALTTEAASGPLSNTLENLADKVMKVCEARNDYSFIYTSDERSCVRGERWRPNTSDDISSFPAYSAIISNPPAPLTPIINWHSSSQALELAKTTAQNGHRDASGFWLDNMVRLRPSLAVDESVIKQLEGFLYGNQKSENLTQIQKGIFNPSVREVLDLKGAFLNLLLVIGYTGCYEPHVCEMGLFYSQVNIRDRQNVELFAAAGIKWKFGNPGLARWNDNGVVRYCAGVFAGALKLGEAKSVLMI